MKMYLAVNKLHQRPCLELVVDVALQATLLEVSEIVAILIQLKTGESFTNDAVKSRLWLRQNDSGEATGRNILNREASEEFWPVRGCLQYVLGRLTVRV
jgi:hypothetical protein